MVSLIAVLAITIASDGTLTVRKLNAIDGYFEGEVVSGDFSWSQHRGYKLYRTSAGTGVAHLPLLYTYQMKNYEEYTFHI